MRPDILGKSDTLVYLSMALEELEDSVSAGLPE